MPAACGVDGAVVETLKLAGAGFLEWLAAEYIVRPAEPDMKAEPQPYLAAVVPFEGSY